ncbi:unnamed protein product [Allacma fusca]|uniref:DH domain-containing protein n=1 Tax=Allacma fusca TaxID=39272 RepID=A0A8J2LSV1_9HEXA|nr:unnamed protein product [Allacma fusca]
MVYAQHCWIFKYSSYSSFRVKGDWVEDTVIDLDAGDSTDILKTPVAATRVSISKSGAIQNESEASPLKRGRFELEVINDFNETEVEASRQAEFGSERAKVLKVEWFWNSIQIEACSDEKLYLLDGRGNHGTSFDLDLTMRSVGTPASLTSPCPISDTDGTPKTGTPSSTGRRKRKRMREFVSSLAQVDYPRFISEIPEDTIPNLGGNSLEQDKDVVSDTEFAQILKDLSAYLKTADVKIMTGRQIDFYQLLETERNYVTVLMNIVKIFKEPCEKEDQTGGRILNTQEIKTIFSTMLPIYSLHRRLLRDLFQLQTKWNEENLIGKIYFDYAGELRKVYEPFRNANQNVHTPRANPDYDWITKGQAALNHCIQCLNEGKAKNEARVAIFETFAEVDGCPAKTISNHRTLLSKFDVNALCDLWGQKFDPITLFVYTDHIQVTKRKGYTGGSNKAMATGVSMANLRSPSVGRKSFAPGSMGPNHHTGPPKRYKFCEWIDFTEVKRVLDVFDTASPSFAFVVRGPRDLRERILVFTCPEDPEWPKESLLVFLAKQLANAVNRVDFENLIAKADSASLNVNENAATVLEKAARFATKTKHKVGRALSLNRTPSKLKRTMSQMMSPFTTHRHRQDPDSISQFGGDSPPPAAKLPTFQEWK